MSEKISLDSSEFIVMIFSIHTYLLKNHNYVFFKSL